MQKVQIWTKIAGSLKKMNDDVGSIEAGDKAYRLCMIEMGEKDV